MTFAALTTPSGNNSRQAALLLHAMPAQDQQWLLNQLPAEQQASMQALLQELVTLGIPADQALLGQALVPSRMDPPAETPALPSATVYRQSLDVREPVFDPPAPLPPLSDLAYLRQLDPAGLAALAGLLRAEPALLVAKVLELQAWPWRQALLSQLNPVQHRQVLECLAHNTADADMGSALAAALWRTLRQRCEGATPAPPRREAQAWVAAPAHRASHPNEASAPAPLLSRIFAWAKPDKSVHA